MGVGAAVANALSERLEVRVKRGGKLHEVVFDRGVQVGKMRKSVSELTEYVRPEVRRRADSLDPGLLRRTLCADLSGKCPAECNPVNPSKACIKKGIKHRVPRVTMRTLHMMVDAERSHRRIRLPLRLELPKALRTTRTTRKGGK